MTQEIQAEIWTNGIEWAAKEIVDLRSMLAKEREELQRQYFFYERQAVYLRARTHPVTFVVDRGNFKEIAQVFEPLDQQRLYDMVMGKLAEQP